MNESHIPYKIIYEHSPAGILVTDENALIRSVNPAELHLLGYNYDEVIGKETGDFVCKEDRARFLKALQGALRTIEQDIEVEVIHKQGHLIPVLRKIHAYYEADSFEGYIIQSINISERRKLLDTLRHQAQTDSLSKLLNRRAFQSKADYMIDYARRYNQALCLIFVDLDKFKSANDTWGHEVGDHIIEEMGERINSTIRSSDAAARIGGDEFAILLNTGRKEGEDFASRLFVQLHMPFHIEGKPVNSIGVSMGLSIFPEDGASLIELLKKADIAMYDKKRRGGAGFQFYTTDNK